MPKSGSKKINVITCILFSGFVVHSQTPAGPPARPANEVNIRNNYATEFNITDVNGRPFKPGEEELEGSPYFIDNLKYSTVKFSDGRVFEKMKSRLNLNTHEAQILTKNQVEFVIPVGLVREVVIFDSLETGISKYTFRTGFPAIDGQTGLNFYQVLVEGSVTMLRFINKKIIQRKNDISGEITREFETYEDYYFYVDKKMHKIKKDKDFILSFLEYRKSEVDAFLKTTKINFKKMSEVQALLSYYNSL